MRRCSIFAPSRTWTSWKEIVCDSVAVNSLIGTLTRPKASVPFQMERGAMPRYFPARPVTIAPRPERGRPAVGLLRVGLDDARDLVDSTGSEGAVNGKRIFILDRGNG